MSQADDIHHIKGLLPERSQRAIIREEECIGCTKCIPTCPTDAILGARKQMHTIITDACTGCEQCVAPCPVDCIDIVPLEQAPNESIVANWQTRYEKHQQRPQQKEDLTTDDLDSLYTTLDDRKSAIQAALDRVKRKKDGS